MELTIALIALVVAILIYVARRNDTYWLRRDIPHDAPHFPLGNMSDFPSKRAYNMIFKDFYLKYKKSGGPFAGFYFYLKKAIIITDLELIKKVLIKDFNSFENRGFFYNEIDDPLTGHLFTIEGLRWRSVRNKVTPTFTSGKIKQMFPLVVNIAEDMTKVINEVLAGKEVLEITDLVARYAADVIGNCAFGLDCKSLQNPKAEFVMMGKRALKERRYWGLLDFFLFGCPRLARRMRLKILPQDVADFYIRIVRDMIDYRIENKVQRNDFMDMLIELYQKHQAGNEEEGVSFGELAAQAFVFFLAGFETSSTTIGFTLYELAQHQEIQDQLREEIEQMITKNNNEFNYEVMKEMKYLELIIMETLRKYPVLGLLSRVANYDYSPGDPKYHIEKDTLVMISILGVHYDPDIYPEPEKFIPERFTEAAIEARPPCTWLPFGKGPRNCIGARFALMGIYIGMVHLIRNYRFSVAPETQIPFVMMKNNLLIAPENGIYLKIEKISK